MDSFHCAAGAPGGRLVDYGSVEELGVGHSPNGAASKSPDRFFHAKVFDS
jgi:hypothetical protein